MIFLARGRLMSGNPHALVRVLIPFNSTAVARHNDRTNILSGINLHYNLMAWLVTNSPSLDILFIDQIASKTWTLTAWSGENVQLPDTIIGGRYRGALNPSYCRFYSVDSPSMIVWMVPPCVCFHPLENIIYLSLCGFKI